MAEGALLADDVSLVKLKKAIGGGLGRKGSISLSSLRICHYATLGRGIVELQDFQNIKWLLADQGS